MMSKTNIYNLGTISSAMENNLISLRVPKPLLKDAKRIVQEEGFSTLQEFIKHSLREELLKRRREQAIIDLGSLRGSAKKHHIKRSRKEVEEHIKKVFS